MKLALMIGAVLILLVVAMFVIGMMTPVGHTTTQERSFAAPPDKVWGLVRQVGDYPRWRSGVKSVSVEGNRFIEDSAHGKIAYRLEEVEAGRKLVSTIDDPNLPFSGSWTWELSPEGAGTRLRITEQGEVPHPLFRFMSTYVFSHEKTLRTYLEDLGRTLQ